MEEKLASRLKEIESQLPEKLAAREEAEKALTQANADYAELAEELAAIKHVTSRMDARAEAAAADALK